MISKPLQRLLRHLTFDEDGAVMIVFGLLIVMLLVFAAFTVDLGAAWGERRQDQTAADAAAMAGAIEYVRSNPSDADVVALVQDYVERNIGYPAGAAGWNGCPAPTDGFAALAGNNCVSLKQASTESSDTLLKVRIPDQLVETSFAQLIGVDTIAVNAEAVARIEQHLGVQGALPFVLPLDAGTEYCLGTPPSGQIRDVCEKQSSGFYGTVESPFFGAEDDPWGSDQTCNGGGSTIIQTNTAIGIDHFLGIAPVGSSWTEHPDDCSSANNGVVPKALFADQGGLNQVAEGFTGPGGYGSLSQPGRLRQSGGSPASWRDVPWGNWASGAVASFDNVGLWNYLIHPDNAGDPCHSSFFDDELGTQLTVNMLECLNNGSVKLDDSLLTSPRFAIVPQIDLLQADLGDISPAKATNIVKFIPVYIQTTWYNCNSDDCMLFPSDDDPGFIPEVFDPGEGTEIGCDGTDLDKCKTNTTAALNGLSAFVFENDDWLPDGFDNQFNDPNAYNVYLYR